MSKWGIAASLLLLAAAAWAQRADRAWIDSFVTVPVSRLDAGQDLRYFVVGAPGGTGSIQVAGLKEPLPLREVAPGFYQAAYKFRPADDPRDFTAATATLRIGEQVVQHRNERAFPPAPDEPGTNAASR